MPTWVQHLPNGQHDSGITPNRGVHDVIPGHHHMARSHILHRFRNGGLLRVVQTPTFAAWVACASSSTRVLTSSISGATCMTRVRISGMTRCAVLSLAIACQRCEARLRRDCCTEPPRLACRSSGRRVVLNTVCTCVEFFVDDNALLSREEPCRPARPVVLVVGLRHRGTPLRLWMPRMTGLL